MGAETLYGLGIALIIAGILVVLAAVLLLFISNIKRGGKMRGGGAIIIGPFPIVFGTDKESLKMVLILSILLTIMLVVITIVFYMLFR
ncbi:MAG: TIGR00304 family membrane protein [Candidatus Bathyarchaeales archaeon]